MRRLQLASALLALAGTVACSDGGDDAAPTGGAPDVTSSTSTTGAADADTTAEPADPAALVGVDWVVDHFVEGEEVIEIDPPDRDGILRFEANGYVSGHDGCNRFGWGTNDATGEVWALEYEIADGRISYDGGGVTTLMFCHEQEYERRFHDAIDGVVTYELDGDQLVVRAGRGHGVVFTAAA